MIAGRGDRGTAALAATVIAWSIVVVASSFLPLVDLPQHVAAAQLLFALDRPEVRALYDATLFPQVNVLGLYVSAGFGPIPRYGPFANDPKSVCFEKRLR